MFGALLKTFKIPKLLITVLFIVLLICIYRIGFSVPQPAVDQTQLAERLSKQDVAKTRELVEE